jgi:hypothetical protein
MTNENSTIIHEGITYRKVNRKANVGEKVLAVMYQGENARIGDVLTVSEAKYDDGSIHTIEGAFFDTDYEEYLVLEPIAEPSDLTQSDDLLVTEADVRNNPRQVIDMFTSLALNNTKLAARLTLLEGEHQALGERVERLTKLERRQDAAKELFGVIDERIDRLASANEQAMTTVARNVETWAQEHENLKHELAKVDERTQPYQQAHELFVKIAGGMNGRGLTAEERREL